MSTGNSPASPAVLYHQALHAFHHQTFRSLAARMMVENIPLLDFELSTAQTRAVLYARLEFTSQHENSQECHSVQQGGGVSQHQAPDQSTLPRSSTPTSAAPPHAYPSQVSTPNRPSSSTVISAPSSVKKRALGKADFAAYHYIHDIHVAAQPDRSMESYMDSFYKDDTKQSIPGRYEAFQASYSLFQPLNTSHVLPQDIHLQHAGAGHGGLRLNTPFPPPSAFGGLYPFLYHPAQHTD